MKDTCLEELALNLREFFTVKLCPYEKLSDVDLRRSIENNRYQDHYSEANITPPQRTQRNIEEFNNSKPGAMLLLGSSVKNTKPAYLKVFAIGVLKGFDNKGVAIVTWEKTDIRVLTKGNRGGTGCTINHTVFDSPLRERLL